MRREIVFRQKDWIRLAEHLEADTENESAAIGICKLTSTSRLHRYLVRTLILPGPQDYQERSLGFVSIRPQFMEKCFRLCEETQSHMLDIHNHPFSHDVRFSAVDDRADTNAKGPYMDRYVPGVELAFMVCGRNTEDLDARIWNREFHGLKPIDLVKVL